MYYHDLDLFEDWNDHVTAFTNVPGACTSKVKSALDIVEKYHDQPRMYTVGNYNRHPLRVARILAEEMNIVDETTILISLCHDLGEWSAYNIKDLANEFSKEVYEGVKVLTWDQEGEWSDFVNSIVQSNIKNLIAIKIADKLDNNRALALSGNNENKKKSADKTRNTILPLVQKYYPEMETAYEEVLSRLQ